MLAEEETSHARLLASPSVPSQIGLDGFRDVHEPAADLSIPNGSIFDELSNMLSMPAATQCFGGDSSDVIEQSPTARHTLLPAASAPSAAKRRTSVERALTLPNDWTLHDVSAAASPQVHLAGTPKGKALCRTDSAPLSPTQLSPGRTGHLISAYRPPPKQDAGALGNKRMSPALYPHWAHALAPGVPPTHSQSMHSPMCASMDDLIALPPPGSIARVEAQQSAAQQMGPAAGSFMSMWDDPVPPLTSYTAMADDNDDCWQPFDSSSEADFAAHQCNSSGDTEDGEGDATGTGDTSGTSGGPRRPAGRRGRKTSVTHIDLAFLERGGYFDLPIQDAAGRLRVGVTTLKKLCRKFHVGRWPYRKRSSVEKMIDTTKKCMDGPMAEEERAESANVLRTLEHQLELLQTNPHLDLEDKIKDFRQGIFKQNYKNKKIAERNPRHSLGAARLSDPWSAGIS
ncbi:hypothetical protein WJX72_006457 [[Myrmecia] bisecta]|uniref:RWP-RK domain-containing protein n=1 Tax=[Myrmecia] bisecta TaxID=41462 RepID=A0AAW1QRV1_9CHLO